MSLFSKEDSEKARQAKKDAERESMRKESEGDIEAKGGGGKSTKKLSSGNNDKMVSGGGKVSFAP